MKKLTETIVKQRVRSCVTDIDKIVQINLTGRDLEDVSLLRRMTNVEILSLSFNKISSLVDFQFCENLKELYLRRNNIQDLNEVYHLIRLPKLEMLMLSENPCSDDPLYRPTIIRNLQALNTLDGVEITPEERKTALKIGTEFPRALASKKSHGGSLLDVNKSMEIANDGDGKETQLPTKVESNDIVFKNYSKNTIAIHNASSSMYALGASKSSKNLLGVESKKCFSKVKDSKMNACKFCKSQPIENQIINLDKTPIKPQKNSNILSATLSLVKELDYPGLQIVNAEIISRLSSLEVEFLYNKKLQTLETLGNPGSKVEVELTRPTHVDK